MPHQHEHSKSNLGKALQWGALGLGSVIAAPYVLPMLGIGNMDTTQRLLGSCGSGFSGMAAAADSAIQSIPLIGPSLHAGGLTGAISAGVIGIGGLLLGRYIENHYDRPGHIPWGKVIRYASLATSLLIALPSILSSLTVGLTFLASLGGIAMASHAFGGLYRSLGLAGTNVVAAGAGFSGILPHLFTCGSAILPLGLRGWLMSKQSAAELEGSEMAGVRMQMAPMDPIVAGEPCELRFQLIDTKSGKALTPDALATLHTKKLHTMVVDASLSDYHHLHPQYDAAQQMFTCSFTPKLAQPYTAWHDLMRAETKEQIHLRNALPTNYSTSLPPTILPLRHAAAQDVQINLSATPLRVGSESILSIDASDRQGNILTDLEPVMGAYAHLVGFSQDGKHLIHCHPMGDEPDSPNARGNGKLQFHITPEVAGNTKFFLQIQHHGKEVIVPFGQHILPPAKFTDRVSMPAQTHGMAMHRG